MPNSLSVTYARASEARDSTPWVTSPIFNARMNGAALLCLNFQRLRPFDAACCSAW